MSTTVFVPEIEIEERDVVLAVDHRTMPLYPTAGPGDGRTWGEFFKDIKAPYREAAAAAVEPEDDEPEEIEIIVRGYDLDEAERAALSARSAPAQLLKRLTVAGWSVRVVRSLARIPAVLYKSDSDEGSEKEYRKGDVHFPAYDLETLIVIGVARTRSGRTAMVVEATWTSKKGFTGAKTWDFALGEEWRPGMLKPREPNAIEIEDGVTPPMSLKDWLAIVCPKPVPRKRVKKGETDGSGE